MSYLVGASLAEHKSLMAMEKGQGNETVVPIVESDLRLHCCFPLRELRKVDQAQKQDTAGHGEAVICCKY